jgi:hypothetical protein
MVVFFGSMLVVWLLVRSRRRRSEYRDGFDEGYAAAMREVQVGFDQGFMDAAGVQWPNLDKSRRR